MDNRGPDVAYQFPKATWQTQVVHPGVHAMNPDDVAKPVADDSFTLQADDGVPHPALGKLAHHAAHRQFHAARSQRGYDVQYVQVCPTAYAHVEFLNSGIVAPASG
jgi:hypothetical protein